MIIWISCLIIFPVGCKYKHFHAPSLIWFLLEASSFLHDRVFSPMFPGAGVLQPLRGSPLHPRFLRRQSGLSGSHVREQPKRRHGPRGVGRFHLNRPITDIQAQIHELTDSSDLSSPSRLWKRRMRGTLTNEWTSTLKQTIEVCNIENLAISSRRESDSNVRHYVKSWMNFEHFSIKFPSENLSAVVARSLERWTLSLWYCGISVCIQMILTFLCVYF